MKELISNNKTKILIHLGLVLITFSLVYTSSLNPFTSRIMNVDTSVYVSITQGILRGQILYRDLVDNKGPLNYFLSVPGFYLGGIIGIWLTEFIFIFISFLFMYKTALMFVNEINAFLTMFFTSLAMHPFYFVNAGAEVYSLPFLVISLYIFSRHYIMNRNASLLELLTLGICFSSSILIRLNMFPLWAGFCLTIIIESAIKKKFLNIVKYIITFSFGVSIVIFPVYLYLKLNNILPEFYLYVISGGVSRGFQASLLRDFANFFYIVINRSFSFLPLGIGIIWFFIRYKNINTWYFLGFILSYLLSVIFLSFSSGFSYYNLILIPFFVPTLAFLTDSLLSLFSNIKYKRLAVIFLFCVLFSEGIVRLSYYVFFNFDSGIQIRNAGRFIDENTEPGDKIINLGGNAYIYPFTAREYASKYIFQDSSAFAHIPGARDEFVSTIISTKPKIISIFTAQGDVNTQLTVGWHEDILDLLATDYKLVSENYGFKIFLRL